MPSDNGPGSQDFRTENSSGLLYSEGQENQAKLVHFEVRVKHLSP